MKRQLLTRLILSGMFIALGLLLPFLTAQNPILGQRLLLMHIPVLICGFTCGWPFGLAVGLITPLFRSFLTTMPPIFPTAVAMAFELAAYGFLAGLFYRLLPKRPAYTLLTLILSMLGGRLIWGAAQFILLGLSTQAPFTFEAFLAGAFINALPGILLQLFLIPTLVLALGRTGLMQADG